MRGSPILCMALCMLVAWAAGNPVPEEDPYAKDKALIAKVSPLVHSCVTCHLRGNSRKLFDENERLKHISIDRLRYNIQICLSPTYSASNFYEWNAESRKNLARALDILGWEPWPVEIIRPTDVDKR